MITIHWLIHPTDFINDFDPAKSKIDGINLFMQLLERMLKSEEGESKCFIIPLREIEFKPDSPMYILKSLSTNSSFLRFVFDSPYGNVILLTETYKDIDPLIENVDKLGDLHCLKAYKHDGHVDEPILKLIAENIPFKQLSQIIVNKTQQGGEHAQKKIQEVSR